MQSDRVVNTDIMVIEGTSVLKSKELEGLKSQKPPVPDTIQERATKRIALAIVVGQEKSCQDLNPLASRCLNRRRKTE